jgi:anti-sigma factor ChrR (cupin superfamily)
MNLNADFSQRVVVHTDTVEWLASPMAGVHRRMLDRIGDEVARATTVVRYAPGSRFSAHTHTGGEEFLVLQGVFQDEHGDFPAGCYVRNPPTSRHTPGSDDGCVILVKLWQFDLADRTQVRTNTQSIDWVADPNRPNVSVQHLFADTRETVQMERWDAGAVISMDLAGGGEFFVVDGTAQASGDVLRAQSWLRIPPGGRLQAVAGPQGTRLWSKTGHLAHISTVE